jgi:diphosphomevalonate decarboxylase
MHLLFHTARPAFMYMNAGSQKALTDILSFWQKASDGPLVTMDAGSNVHLLFREDQLDMINAYEKHFSPEFNLWTRHGYRKRK